MESLSQLSEFQRIRKLKQDYYLLHLTYHRNYNQHRVSVWWRHFNILHRWIRKLLDKLLTLETCKKSAEKIRLRKEASGITRFLIRGHIFHNAYYAFNGIIALGQFISLGLGLLAITGSLHSVVRYMYDEIEQVQRIKAPKPTKASEPEGDDVGEEITYEAGETLDKSVHVPYTSQEHIESETIQKTENMDRKEKKEKKEKREKKEKKSKKKKKSRNAIDDIFG